MINQSFVKKVLSLSKKLATHRIRQKIQRIILLIPLPAKENGLHPILSAQPKSSHYSISPSQKKVTMMKNAQETVSDQNDSDINRRSLLKYAGGIAAMSIASTATLAQTPVSFTEEWDKTFPKSDKVDHKKVTFKNRYGITLVADLYQPKAYQNC